VLVNNAGTEVSTPALASSLDEFRDMIGTDLTATFALSRFVGAV
jgi:short-subunit dehydrogenase